MGSAPGLVAFALSLLLASRLAAAQPAGITIAAGYEAEVFATGVADPVDLAPGPGATLVVLDSGGPTGVGHVLYRLPITPLGSPATDARPLARMTIRVGAGGMAYPAGAVAVHPRSGQAFLSEFAGKRLYRVDADGRLALYTTGFWMLPRGAIRFDGTGRLLVLDFPGELSGGEQQRAAIARAMTNDTEILFCDEPTGNLDARMGSGIIELLRDLFRGEKKTVLIVTHDERIAKTADRVIEIEKLKGN